MRTKSFPKFYIFLLVFVILAVVLVNCSKSFLRDVLAEYEDSQYKYVAESYFNNTFAEGDSKTLVALFVSQISDFESEDALSEYIHSIIENKEFSIHHSSTGMSDKEKYVVSVDNLKFAEFYISKSNEKTEHGFDTYEVTETVLNSNLLHSFSILVPQTYSVTANGKAVGEQYALGDRIETESQRFMPAGVDGIIYTTYVIDKLCLAPEISVSAPNGSASSVSIQNDGVYYANVVSDETLAAKYTDYVISATQAYACYMQKDANFGKVKGYLDPGSAFYKYVKETPTWPVISHNGYSFEDAEVTEFYSYNEDVFSCRISLTHVLKYSGLEDYRDNIDITWYFKESNGKFLIYDSFTH